MRQLNLPYGQLRLAGLALGDLYLSFPHWFRYSAVHRNDPTRAARGTPVVLGEGYHRWLGAEVRGSSPPAQSLDLARLAFGNVTGMLCFFFFFLPGRHCASTTGHAARHGKRDALGYGGDGFRLIRWAREKAPVA